MEHVPADSTQQHPAESVHDDATFITATNIRRPEAVVVNDPPGMDRARQLHSQLAGVVTTLNDKVCVDCSHAQPSIF